MFLAPVGHRLAFFLLALIGLSAELASAQTASQLTPPTLRPERAPLQGLEGTLVFSGRPGLEAPAGAERFSVTITGVTIDGALPQMEQANRAFEQRLVGRPVPLTEIFAAAQELETAYAQAGFVLNRVVIPEQTLKDGGQLRVVVVSGFVERVDLQNLPPAVRSRIEQVMRPLIRQPGLTLSAIERQLLLAGDTAGVALTSALSPGTEPGSTVITLDAQYRPITGSVGFDNTLSDELGTWAVSAGLEANSVLHLGELIYFRFTGNPQFTDDDTGGLFDEFPRMRSVGGGVVLPIGTDGLAFNVEAVQSNTTPEYDNGFETPSKYQRLSLRLQYPWIRSRTLNINSQLIFDATSNEFSVILPDDQNVPLSEDKLRILRLATDGSWQRESGAVARLGGVLSQGLDSFGARSADDATDELPLSRFGADADFTKFDLAASYSQQPLEHFAYVLLGRGQSSFGEPLPQSEQIGIASFQELSTFDAGTLAGDSGYVLRADALSPWPFSAPMLPPMQITPYVFGAFGQLFLAEPTAFEDDNTRVASLGIGLDLTTVIDPAFSGASLTVEFGRAFRSDDFPDENRFTIVGGFTF